MPSFSWEPKESRYFGQVLVPVVRVELRSARGTYRQFSFVVDSGAIVTLVPRAVGEILGIPVDAGRRIELGAVGGAQTVAFVHLISAQLEGVSPLTIPIAFAAHNDVPKLLGRVSVFDRLRILFEPRRSETIIDAA